MAAYHKVEVSLNTNAVEVGVPSLQSVTVTVPTVGPQGPQGPQGEQGPPGSVSGSIAWANVTDKPSTFTPSAHTHTSDDITDFTEAVEAVSPPADWNTLANKPTIPSASTATPQSLGIAAAGTASAYSREDHVHPLPPISDTVSLQDANENTFAAVLYEEDGISKVDLAFNNVAYQTLSADNPLVVQSDLGTAAAEDSTAFDPSGTAASAVSAHAGKTDGTAHSISGISGLQTALDGKVGTSDARLSDSREWSAATIDQTEAETGTSTTRRAFTALRVFQAIAAWWNGSAAKTKLDGIASGAEVNVQADWNQSNNAADDFIKNKPTLGTAAAEDSTAFATSAQGDKADSALQPTLIDAKGDLLVGSAADTVSRLAVGATNGHVLKINSATATGLEWGAAPAGDTVSIDASAADILSATSGAISADDAGSDKIVFWDESESRLRYLEAGSGLSISGTTLTATATGTIGGSTATDNAIVRADSTANTVQESALSIDDATTSTQNNVAITNQHSGQTDSSIVITPKGGGAFILGPKPDGTTTGGSSRGVRAIDLQISRASNANRASGQDSVCIGYNNLASNTGSIAIGDSNSVSGSRASAWGRDNTASNSQCFAIGRYAVSDRFGQLAFAIDRFASSNGSAQQTFYVLNGKTTTNSAVALTTPSGHFSIPAGKVVSMLINITGIKYDGSAVAHYMRQYALKNVGGLTSEVYAPVMIGTDNAEGTSISITADDTSDILKVECTGITSQTWRWTASLYATETTYGT